MTDMETKDFLDAAMQPDFPDEIALQIDNDNPRRRGPTETFSREAVDSLAEQFHTFLMARLVGRTTKTGLGPRHVRATVTLDWAPQHPHEDAGPYFHISQDKGLTPLDHTRRWKAVE